MTSLCRYSSYGIPDNISKTNTNTSALYTGSSIVDMNQNHNNYTNMTMPPAPLHSMNMNMTTLQVPINMGGMNMNSMSSIHNMNNMNMVNNMNMGAMGGPMGYNNQGYPVSGGMNVDTGVGVGVGIPVAAANYARQHFPSSNKAGLASQLSYSETEGFDPRSATRSITPSTQTKSPLSPLLYQQNNSNNTPGVGKGSVVYPLTPQQLHSQQGQYPLTPPIYDNRMNAAGVSGRETNRLRELAEEDSKRYGDHVSGNSGTGGESRELYYEMSSKTYVSKTREEGREGLRTGALVKVDAEHERGGNSGRGRRKKKLTGSGNESDEDDDSDGRDESRNPENRETSGSRTRNKRSRGGCLTCRQRKKRCCESKPVCSECRRLNIKCRWPVPGSEHKNKSKNQPHMSHDEVYHEVYGVIKVLRGVVDYKIEP